MNDQAAERAAWVENRKSYLGGTDLAKLLGISKYGDALDVFRDKAGLAPEEEMPFYVELGNFLEPAIAQTYANEHQVELEKLKDPVAHPEFPFLAGNPDFLVLQDPDKGLEIKAVTERALWTGEWGADGSPDARLDYQIQCQWYMGLTGRSTWDLRAAFVDWDQAEKLLNLGLTPSQFLACILKEIRTYPLTADPDFFALMQKVGRDFWEKNFLLGVPPPATAKSSPDARVEMLRGKVKSFSEEATATPEDQDLGVEYALATSAAKATEAAAKAIKAKLDARIIELGTKRLKGKGWSFGAVEPKDTLQEDAEAVMAELAQMAGLSGPSLATIRAKHTKVVPATPYTQGWMTGLQKTLAAAKTA